MPNQWYKSDIFSQDLGYFTNRLRAFNANKTPNYLRDVLYGGQFCILNLLIEDLPKTSERKLTENGLKFLLYLLLTDNFEGNVAGHNIMKFLRYPSIEWLQKTALSNYNYDRLIRCYIKLVIIEAIGENIENDDFQLLNDIDAEKLKQKLTDMKGKLEESIRHLNKEEPNLSDKILVKQQNSLIAKFVAMVPTGFSIWKAGFYFYNYFFELSGITDEERENMTYFEGRSFRKIAAFLTAFVGVFVAASVTYTTRELLDFFRVPKDQSSRLYSLEDFIKTFCDSSESLRVLLDDVLVECELDDRDKPGGGLRLRT